MSRVPADRLSTVRMAWRVAGEQAQDNPASLGGRTATRPLPVPERHIASFVDGCRRISAAEDAIRLAPSRIARKVDRLPSTEALRERMRLAASQALVVPAVPSAAPTGLLSRVASWVGLLPEKAGGPRGGLLEGMVRTGVPLREELLESVEQFHVQLNSWQLEQNVQGRARQGAVLLTQLQAIGELLAAAQGLSQSGHGHAAGLDTALLEELAQQTESTQLAVAQVVALPAAHASFVAGVQRNWQQALSQVDTSDV